MSQDRPIADERRYRELRRRTLAFSLLGLLLCTVFLAVIESAHVEASSASALDLLGRAEAEAGRFALHKGPALASVGVVAGLFAGMLGMGGGVVKVAGLLLVFHLDILFARAVSLTTMFVATGTAARVHSRNGTVVERTVSAMLVPALLGVLAGILLGSVVPKPLLTRFFGFFTVFMGLTTLANSIGDPDERVLRGDGDDPQSGGSAVHTAIGGIHGLLCGLLGISGGVIAVPMQQTFARIRAVNAVANTVVVSAWATGLGSIAAVASGVAQGHFAMLDVLFATVCVGIGAAVGASIGARLTGRIPVFVLRLLFTLICLVVGLSILFG